MNNYPDIKKNNLLGLFISMAIVLHVVESFIPYFFVPWAKLGLPNIITILTLMRFDLKSGLIVTFTRTILGGLIVGTLFNPISILSICAGITSTFAIWLTLPLLNKKFTLVSVSIISALVHIVTQFTIVYEFFLGNSNSIKTSFFYSTPWFLIFALPSGLITGIAANIIISYLDKINYER